MQYDSHRLTYDSSARTRSMYFARNPCITREDYTLRMEMRAPVYQQRIAMQCLHVIDLDILSEVWSRFANSSTPLNSSWNIVFHVYEEEGKKSHVMKKGLNCTIIGLAKFDSEEEFFKVFEDLAKGG